MLETMPSPTIELLKVIGSFAGGATGAVSGMILKQWLDHRALLAAQKQTRWLPLLDATRELKARLEELQQKYPKHHVENSSELPSIALDFWELYTLDKERRPFLESLEDPDLDAILDQSRERELDVQRVRRRMCHQLNYAASSFYAVAKYVAYAERVRKDLQEGRLRTPTSITEAKMIRLISCVRRRLNGISKEHPGAGIIFEQQESVAESVWGPDDRVISYFEFRQRLLNRTGWEQFTGLFRFFVHFDKKIDTEVKQIIKALKLMCRALELVSQQVTSEPARTGRFAGYYGRYGFRLSRDLRRWNFIRASVVQTSPYSKRSIRVGNHSLHPS